jgi:hypothetical protein
MHRAETRTSNAGDAERLSAEEREDGGSHEGGHEDLGDAILAGGLNQVQGEGDAG